MTRSWTLLLLASPLFLAGCPQGAPHPVDGQDDVVDGAVDETSPQDGVDADAGPPPTTGALCGANGQNACGPMQCSAELVCVECLVDEHCAITAPHCLLGACVGCRPGRGDCADGSACSTADYECRPRCVEGDRSSCPAGTACDGASGECLGCRGGPLACASGACSPERRQCVGCASDLDCSRELPRCRRAVGVCVACTSNADCGVVAPICDPATFRCRAGCASDADCAEGSCDLATARCVIASPADAGTPAVADGGDAGSAMNEPGERP